ncbi:2Fe-2S iron-sulfur cluster-binding protein [Vibrio hangzhouensis]|uniref:Ferredoxin n=1 Tax=Vibrio hangzhouensis TaxID=462991 RepID=A0A1H6CHJ0_9VIBR|nr:2Fe-2S iron-sulfur cluster-binding protein [Vibrio hangzhouensis]MBY6199618.1 2Fe-2S iron-sulfur cluster binding domain-containing protein [Vibrio hangzhouensis]SEG72362.1 Ferredoxin [Vibrio hangzhouensis]
MILRVTLKPQNIEFTVEEGQTVLDAALNQNLAFPHRCRVGACASCLCRIESGEVEYDLEPMLTEKEKQQGWMFSCLAYPKSDLVINLEEE